MSMRSNKTINLICAFIAAAALFGTTLVSAQQPQRYAGANDSSSARPQRQFREGLDVLPSDCYPFYVQGTIFHDTATKTDIELQRVGNDVVMKNTYPGGGQIGPLATLKNFFEAPARLLPNGNFESRFNSESNVTVLFDGHPTNNPGADFRLKRQVRTLVSSCPQGLMPR